MKQNKDAQQLKIDEVVLIIDEVPYRQVDAPGQYGADEPVFQFDRQNGRIRFGDGVHGRRPLAGSRVRMTYHTGGGAAGNLVEFNWPGDDCTHLQRLAVLPQSNTIQLVARLVDETSWRWQIYRWIEDWLFL